MIPATDLDGAYLTFNEFGPHTPPVIDPTPDVYARDVAVTFPELAPVAALDMHAPVRRREAVFQDAPVRRIDATEDTRRPWRRRRGF